MNTANDQAEARRRTTMTMKNEQDSEQPAIPPLPPATGSADGDAGAIALLRCLPTRELEAAYRLAKADETDNGQHSACLIGRELIRRASPPNAGGEGRAIARTSPPPCSAGGAA